MFWCNTIEDYTEIDDCRNCHNLGCEHGYAKDPEINDGYSYTGGCEHIGEYDDVNDVYPCHMNSSARCRHKVTTTDEQGEELVVCGKLL